MHWRGHENVRVRDPCSACAKWCLESIRDPCWFIPVGGCVAVTLPSCSSSSSLSAWRDLGRKDLPVPRKTPIHVCAVAVKNPLWGGLVRPLPHAKWERIIKHLLHPLAVHSFDRWTAVGFPTLRMRKAKMCCSAPRNSAPFVAPMESRTATSACCVPTTCAYCVGELILQADSGAWGSWQQPLPTNCDLSCVTYVNSFGMSLGSTAWHSVA